MELSDDLSQKIVDFLNNVFTFLANQDADFYALSLMSISMITFPIIHMCKILDLAKACYRDVDNAGLWKVNIMNLLSVILLSSANSELPTVLNLFLNSFFISIIIWFVFMLKLFILNVKRYRTKKNFVKKAKKQAKMNKHVGVEQRLSVNDFNMSVPKELTADTTENPITEGDVYRSRISQSELIKRKD